MQKFFVYAIKSQLRSYIYVGLTNNLDRRVNEHNGRRNKTTKPYAPFEIILAGEYPTRLMTREREKYLKSGIGKEYLKSLL